MKTLILYQSKTGATRQYAQWLNQDIKNSVLFTYDQFNADDFSEFDRVIFCMPTYSGQITPKEYLENNISKLEGKKLYLLIVGMVPSKKEWSRRSFNNISIKVRDNLAGYMKLPGISANKPNKKASRIERFFSKLFLKIDPDEINQQHEVFREDILKFEEMLQETS